MMRRATRCALRTHRWPNCINVVSCSFAFHFMPIYFWTVFFCWDILFQKLCFIHFCHVCILCILTVSCHTTTNVSQKLHTQHCTRWQRRWSFINRRSNKFGYLSVGSEIWKITYPTISWDTKNTRGMFHFCHNIFRCMIFIASKSSHEVFLSLFAGLRWDTTLSPTGLISM